MKKQMVKIMAMIAAVLLLAMLTGCGGNTPAPGGADPGKSGVAETPSASQGEEGRAGAPEASPPEGGAQDQGVLVRSDPDGLAEVRIEGGRAELTFALELWEELYDITGAYDGMETENARFLREGPFAVKSSSGKRIKDVCIGIVEALNDRIYGFDDLALALLLEDGTVEYCPVRPYPWQGMGDWVYYGWGKLPWIENIASLLYEPDGEGIGEMTIYAADKDGLCYDIRTLCRALTVFDCDWVYEIGPSYSGDDIDCIHLTLLADGRVFMTEGLLYYGDCWKFYEGKYTVDLTGGKPVIAFELWDEWEEHDFRTPPELKGEYFFTAGYDTLTLYLAEGDPLQYSWDNTPVMTYPFWPDWGSVYEPQPWDGYESEGAGASLDAFPTAYGFADQTGARLIVTCYDTGDGPSFDADPNQFTLAIGPYGEIVPVNYSGWQDETEENDYRAAAYNFSNLPGFIFNAAGGRLRPDRTYVLTTEGALADTLITLNPPAPGMDKRTLMGLKTEDYIYLIKGRGVKWSELLSVSAEGGQIGLFLFEREGDDMLFSIVYLDGPDTLFWDKPAEYDEWCTWRIDMGDEPGNFEPLFLARLDGELVLALTWGAPEGENVVVLYEDGGGFVEKDEYVYSRYWSP